MTLHLNGKTHHLERGVHYEMNFHVSGYSTSRNIVMEFGSADYIINLHGIMYPPSHFRKVYDLDSEKVKDITAYGRTGIALNYITSIKVCTNLAALRALMIDAALEI